MVVKVRGVSDGLVVKLVFAVACLTLLPLHSAQGQQKDETPKQTNEKIQQLASLARTRPVDTPIGTGDLLHIDVFDVPELSRDLRVSDTGDVSFPLIPGKNSCRWPDAISAGEPAGAASASKMGWCRIRRYLFL